MVNEDRRAKLQKFRRLQSEFPPLQRPDGFQDTHVGIVAVVGASNASGFGAAVARATLEAHPHNQIILTARGKKVSELQQIVQQGTVYDPTRTQVIDFDVEHRFDQSGPEANYVVITPAFMDPKYLKPSVDFANIPQEELAKSRRVTVDGFSAAARFFRYQGAEPAVIGVSFAAHDMPGYNIGPIKRELEDRVTQGSQVMPQVSQAIVTLGIFESVAGLGIEGFDKAVGMYDALGIRNPTLSEMAYGLVSRLAQGDLDRKIIELDGGLREAIADPTKRPAYEQFMAILKSQFTP